MRRSPLCCWTQRSANSRARSVSRSRAGPSGRPSTASAYASHASPAGVRLDPPQRGPGPRVPPLQRAAVRGPRHPCAGAGELDPLHVGQEPAEEPQIVQVAGLRARVPCVPRVRCVEHRGDDHLGGGLGVDGHVVALGGDGALHRGDEFAHPVVLQQALGAAPFAAFDDHRAGLPGDPALRDVDQAVAASRSGSGP